MKASSPVHTTKPAPPPTVEESQAFFENAYLSLLSSAFAQFEVRDRDGTLQTLYEHRKLEKEDARLFDEGRPDMVVRRERLQQKVEEADEAARIEVLVDRAYRLAVVATRRYFEERKLASFNSSLKR